MQVLLSKLSFIAAVIRRPNSSQLSESYFTEVTCGIGTHNFRFSIQISESRRVSTRSIGQMSTGVASIKDESEKEGKGK